jgi:hypothetical protein
MNRAAPEEGEAADQLLRRGLQTQCLTTVASWSYTGVCVSLSAYRGAAVLFKLLDVLVAATQPVPRLVGGFCYAAGFNAHGAQRNGGTAVEWCAQCLAGRWIGRRGTR